MGLSK